MDTKFMTLAVQEAITGVINGEGGPFGAVIVQHGEVIAQGHNMVVCSHDPTAHAEVTVIREASRKLQRFDLSDCELYTTCEPCPMCLAATHWAKIPKLYYGCTADDAAAAGFDDRYIYDVIRGTATELRVIVSQIERDACLETMQTWTARPEKTAY